MRALVIDNEQRAKIAALIETAAEYPIRKEGMQLYTEGRANPIGDNPNHVCHIPQGFRCVYSHEEQPKGWMKHLSVTVNGKGKWVHPAAMEMLMKEFGFKTSLAEVTKWREDEVEAVNVVEFI